MNIIILLINLGREQSPPLNQTRMMISRSWIPKGYMQPPNFFTNFMSSCNVLFFNNRSPNQRIKPMDITLMNRKLKMKNFMLKIRKGMSILLGKLFHMMGSMESMVHTFPLMEKWSFSNLMTRMLFTLTNVIAIIILL